MQTRGPQTEEFPRASQSWVPLPGCPDAMGSGTGPEASAGSTGSSVGGLVADAARGSADREFSLRLELDSPPSPHISPELLCDEGLLGPADIRAEGAADGERALRTRPAFQGGAARLAFEEWRAAKGELAAETARFRRPRRGGSSLAGSRRSEEGDEAAARLFLQLTFQRQWTELRGAAARGVRLMGDAPIFVGQDSVDVEAHPELFRLGPDGAPEVVTGCPGRHESRRSTPGASALRVDAHRAEGFRWWRARMRRQLELFDAVRIDHLSDSATHGRSRQVPRPPRRGVVQTPGRSCSTRSATSSGTSLIAEDLGR